MNLNKRGFTLIEMLIVIVIIGILAAALIPRLNNMQARARDTARKADLSYLGTAISAYFTDFGKYPGEGAYDISDFTSELSPYLSSIPTDPLQNRVIQGIGGSDGEPGQYRFITIEKNGVPDAGFIIAASTETHGIGSNYVIGPNSGQIDTDSEFNDIKLCQNVSNVDPFGTDDNYCTRQTAQGLMYIYKN